jgi:para-nitrobenzyl esterase
MDTTVQTKQGTLRGRLINGIRIFKGVPYAAAPTGPNHLMPPERPPAWEGVRDASEFGPKPPQTPTPAQVSEMLPETPGSGDNCLTLNIWAPLAQGGRRPVMVWIPGGMYEFHATGTSPLYDGYSFARDGVICVTINYRVGAEGFLYLGDAVANCGLLDQIAALQWVRENIANFGGDSGNVTIFGESAGALSVATLLAMPRAQGLFRRAIVQSGGGHHVSQAATAKRIGDRLAEKLGVDARRDAVAALPTERLLEAQLSMRIDLMTQSDPEFWGEVSLSGLPWQPVTDGDTLPGRPIDRVALGASADVDLLIGTNVEENRLFLVPGGEIDRITHKALAEMVAAYGLPVEPTIDNYSRHHPNTTAGELMAAVQTDWYWRLPAIRLADAHALQGRGRTFMYEFAWRSPQFGGRLGACHALEIPFVFDTLGPASAPLAGPNPPQQLADAMHRAWVAFATHGEPGWPGYDARHRITMRFDSRCEVVCDPRRAERLVWEGVR